MALMVRSVRIGDATKDFLLFPLPIKYWFVSLRPLFIDERPGYLNLEGSVAKKSVQSILPRLVG
jgi:hypothetical protein